MSRYIDADALGIGKADRNAFEIPEYADGWNSAIEIISNAPTADVVEVRHGYWLSAYEYAIKLGETNPYRLGIAEHDKIWHFCSLCEQQVRFKRNYCPECGAKMDGEIKEDD